MKKYKRIVSLIVSVLFLINNISFALSPESRFNPISNHDLVRIMKLTAEIAYLAGERDLSTLERAEPFKIDEIKGTRVGDEGEFDYRKKKVLGDGEIIFIPCYIIENGKSTKDRYLCRATKLEKGYDYEFFTRQHLGRSITDALADDGYLEQLAKEQREIEVKEGIARFVKQQNEDDRIIEKTIMSGRNTLLRYDTPWVKEAYDFIESLFPMARQIPSAASLFTDVKDMIELGQDMIIPGLAKPHAGGIGLYSPHIEKYENARTHIHEIFAKCGFSDEDCKKMEDIFAKWQQNRVSPLYTDEEDHLIVRAKKARFEHRLNDPLRIDYWKDLGKRSWAEPTAKMIKELQGKHDWYLGIDLGTQSVKFLVIDAKTREIIYVHAEEFKSKYYIENFNQPGGVRPHSEGVDGKGEDIEDKHFHVDPYMFVDAIDRGLGAMHSVFKKRNWSMKNIKAIGGAGQQHGTAYLDKSAQSSLKLAYRSRPLYRELIDLGVFSIPDSPMWQQAGTGKFTRMIDTLFGGPDETRKETGSKAELRFSLANILKFFTNWRSLFKERTGRIVNLAALLGVILTGDTQFPFDPSDGAGTNAMNIRTNKWLKIINRLTPGIDLVKLLGGIQPSDAIIGKILNYWVRKYDFDPNTKIVNMVGDNPSSATGQGIIDEGQVSISLGTSYTLYHVLKSKSALEKALNCPIGHVFRDVTGKYMWLGCFQNGDKALEKLRDEYISDDEAIEKAQTLGIKIPSDKEERGVLIKRMKIDIFTKLLEEAEPGCNGALLIPQHKDEAMVFIPYNPSEPYLKNLVMRRENRAQIFRAAVEGQIYFLKWVAGQVGLDIREIKITGGVSNNPAVRQIVADIFNAEVKSFEVSDSVALGSAIRALKAHKKLTWDEAIRGLVEVADTKGPTAASVGNYEGFYKQFVGFLEGILSNLRVKPSAEVDKKRKEERLIYDKAINSSEPRDFNEYVKAYNRVQDSQTPGAEKLREWTPLVVAESTIHRLIQRLLAGKSQEYIQKLDAFVDNLLARHSEIAVGLLTGERKSIANYIIDRIAEHDVAIKMKSFIPDNETLLETYLRAAGENPAIAGKAEAIRKMVSDTEFASERTDLRVESIATTQKYQGGSYKTIVNGFSVSEKDRDRVRITKEKGVMRELDNLPKTSFVEIHSDVDQYFTVEEGEIVLLAAPQLTNYEIGKPKASGLTAFVLRPGEVAKIEANTLHMALNRGGAVKFYVHSESKGISARTIEKPETKYVCIGNAYSPLGAYDSSRHITNDEIIRYIEQGFDIYPNELVEVMAKCEEEIDKGLRGEQSSVAMRPDFPFVATGKEKGDVITFDFGGTNMRAKRIILYGGGRYQVTYGEKVTIPDNLFTADSKSIFDFAAKVIKDFMVKAGLSLTEKRPFGFIFSFELEKQGIAQGEITNEKWSKGFVVPDSVGKDPAELLNAALRNNGVTGLRVDVSANDTTGVKEGYKYKYPDCRVGMVIGTGENLCVEVPLEAVKKSIPWLGKTPTGTVDINMESGGFNDVLQTVWDKQLDLASESPGGHISEKMISGNYLGEIARLILRDLIKRGMLFTGKSSKIFDAESKGKTKLVEKEEDSLFMTQYIGAILEDTTVDLIAVHGVLSKYLMIQDSTLEDRRLVKKVCELVTKRGARLAAATIAAALNKSGVDLQNEEVIVAIDGSVYEHNPIYYKEIASTIKELLGDEKASNVKIKGTREGDKDIDDAPSVGVAVMAAIAASMPSETDVDIAVSEIKKEVNVPERKPVIFLPQHYISRERCKGLAKEYEGVEFVPIDQENEGNTVKTLGRYAGSKRCLVLVGKEYNDIEPMLKQNIDFENIVPVSYSASGLDELLSKADRSRNFDRIRYFEKLIISEALLSIALLKKENYIGTKSYLALKSILGLIMPEGYEYAELEEYIRHIAGSAGINARTRFQYLMMYQLQPIVPFDHDQRLRYILDIFISA